MSWAKLDDEFPEHDKIGNLTDKAFRLHVTAICHASRNLTDGRITARALKVCAILAKVGRAGVVAEQLAEAGLWHRPGETCSSDECAAREPSDAWAVHDYLQCNRSKAEVKAGRELNRKRVREHRDRRGNGVTPALRNALQDEDVTAYVTGGVMTPRPDPTYRDTPSAVSPGETEQHRIVPLPTLRDVS